MYDFIYSVYGTFRSSLLQSLPLPTSRYEAELRWEFLRQEVFARIQSLPSSSFERTKLEFEVSFYAAFPRALEAARDMWIAQQFPYAEWAQLPQFYYYSPQFFPSECTPLNLNYEYPIAPYIPVPIHGLRPVQDFSKFSICHALTPLPAPSPTVASCSNIDMNTSTSSQERTTPSPLEEAQLLFELDVLAPARQSVPQSSKPVHEQSPSPLSLSLCPSPAPAFDSSSSLLHLEQPQYTGNWETHAISASKYLHRSANSLIIMEDSAPVLPGLRTKKSRTVEIAPIHRPRHPSPPAQRPTTRRSRSHFSAPAKPKARMPSPDPSTILPLPRKRSKLLRDKDGKPLLACLFCRGRKIACGPPPEGSNSPTCNQCARRGLVCHYPTESRRGMRSHLKKKPEASHPSSSCCASKFAASDDSDSEWDGVN